MHGLMRRVFTIGETVYDILFAGSQPLSATPGGGMLNTAVSLGRAGVAVSLISELGDDPPGRMITDFLESNGVDTQYIRVFSQGKTAVSLAILDENKNASYTFYKIYPPERLTNPFPETTAGDVVVFGSYYALNKDTRPRVVEFVKQARSKGALLLYDPNIRKVHLEEIKSNKQALMENFTLSHIVRGSDEDFSLLFDVSNAEQAYKLISKLGPSCLICTANKNDISLHTKAFRLQIPAETIAPISTIGAGDGFNAGVVCALLKNRVHPDDIDQVKEEQWLDILRTGAGFAAEVCLSYENFIPENSRFCGKSA
jgi:fructokinase